MLLFILTQELTPVIDCAVQSSECSNCLSGYTLVSGTAYYVYHTTLYCLKNSYLPQNCGSTSPKYVYNNDPNLYSINLTSGSTINLDIINTTPGA